MSQIQLPEPLYEKVQKRAAESGFSNVDEYVSNVLSEELAEEPEDLDYLFTPERIAELDQISAEIKAGAKTYSAEEVRQHFEKKLEEWRQKHAG